MSNRVFINCYDVISALGAGSDENWKMLCQNQTGIKFHDYKGSSLPFAKIASYSLIDEKYTKVENLIIQSIQNTLDKSKVNKDAKDFLLILSSTKGNIDVLMKSSIFRKDRSRLGIMAKQIQQYFGLYNEPMILSNACVSGVMATAIARQFLLADLYSNILVCGVDIVSDFVADGFLSFKAISSKLCKPFDEQRDGINLGEAVASILLSNKRSAEHDIAIIAAACSNDANHISGPSRSGDGLAIAITESLREAKMHALDIHYISAHGTATIYNDDMEAKAIESCGLSHCPVNSFKSYIGHTLGAAGICEIIYSVMSIQNEMLIRSLSYESGNSQLNVIKANYKASIQNTLKLSSGFGGCNAALILSQ